MLLALLKVHGHSMQPAILEGQKILVSGFPYFFASPKINDVIAFKHNSKIFVKRISSVKGDSYFLEGDNKDDSLDSRNLGLVERKYILGKVLWH